MQNAQHTPGPWCFWPDGEQALYRIRPIGGGELVAQMFERSNSAHECLANARLIAAAPTMLAALQIYFTDQSRFHKMASDAIAKATGAA